MTTMQMQLLIATVGAGSWECTRSQGHAGLGFVCLALRSWRTDRREIGHFPPGKEGREICKGTPQKGRIQTLVFQLGKGVLLNPVKTATHCDNELRAA